MRLISQNGEIDVPYEITSLSRTGNIIRAYVPMVVNPSEDFLVVAPAVKKNNLVCT